LAISKDGLIEAVDRLNPRLFGRTPDELIGKPLTALMAPDERKHFERVLGRCETGESVWEPLVFLAAGGRRRPLLCCFQPITDRPRRGAILVTGIGMAPAEASARSETAAVLGHLAFHCHRPLHRLMQAVEVILQEHPMSEAARRCRADLDCLVEELTEHAAWPAPEEVADQPMDVVRLLEGTLRVLDTDPSFEGLRVQLRPDEAAVWAHAHPVGLAIVALHLASNARDATAAARSPRLNIDIHPRDAEVVLEFADNGRGMPRDQASAALSSCFTGGRGAAAQVGLGLATCQQLAHFMGGSLRIQSHRGRGTTISLILRAASPPQ
jgi:PAS domain S-box-containing protein